MELTMKHLHVFKRGLSCASLLLFIACASSFAGGQTSSDPTLDKFKSLFTKPIYSWNCSGNVTMADCMDQGFKEIDGCSCIAEGGNTPYNRRTDFDPTQICKSDMRSKDNHIVCSLPQSVVDWYARHSTSANVVQCAQPSTACPAYFPVKVNSCSGTRLIAFKGGFCKRATKQQSVGGSTHEGKHSGTVDTAN
jgi:hypothetical protein